MTSMPVIDDRMVDLFRRTGKRRASFGRLGAAALPAPSACCCNEAEVASTSTAFAGAPTGP